MHWQTYIKTPGNCSFCLHEVVNSVNFKSLSCYYFFQTVSFNAAIIFSKKPAHLGADEDRKRPKSNCGWEGAHQRPQGPRTQSSISFYLPVDIVCNMCLPGALLCTA